LDKLLKTELNKDGSFLVTDNENLLDEECSAIKKKTNEKE